MALASSIALSSSQPISTSPRNFLNTPLKDANGSTEMSVDGSLTPVEFFYRVPERFSLYIISLSFVMLDNSVDPGDFAGINGGITNGLSLFLIDANDKKFGDFFGGDEPIKQNIDIANFTGIGYFVDKGSKKHTIIAELEVSQTNFSIIIEPQNRISVEVKDDLSSIDSFKIRIKGFLIQRGR